METRLSRITGSQWTEMERKMAQTTEKQLGMLVRYINNRTAWDSGFRIKIVPVLIEPNEELGYGKKISYISSFSDDEWSHLADLQIECSEMQWSEEIPSYFWGCSFRDLYEVKLEKAQSMVAVLSKIEKGLEKARESDGDHWTFGHFVRRICKILGVVQIWSYAEGETDTNLDRAQFVRDDPNYASRGIDEKIDARKISWAVNNQDKIKARLEREKEAQAA